MIQDYKPRHFSFSFGFYCKQKLSKSLKGLWYNVSLYSQTNETSCLPMPENISYNCSKYYSQVSLLNLIDHKNREDATKLFDSVFQTKRLLGDLFNCYPYFLEASCYLFFPRCNEKSNIFILPCRQVWEQLGEACLDELESLDNIIDLTTFLLSKAKEILNAFDYEYLPSRFGSIQCWYEEVICQPPLNVTGAVIVKGLHKNGIYVGGSVVKYSCIDHSKQIVGNNTVRCLYNTSWSDPPICREKQSNNNLLKILLPTLFLLTWSVIVVVFIVYIHRRRRRNAFRNLILRRRREFDA